jgi:hypothetical protein
MWVGGQGCDFSGLHGRQEQRSAGHAVSGRTAGASGWMSETMCCCNGPPTAIDEITEK